MYCQRVIRVQRLNELEQNNSTTHTFMRHCPAESAAPLASGLPESTPNGEYALQDKLVE